MTLRPAQIVIAMLVVADVVLVLLIASLQFASVGPGRLASPAISREETGTRDTPSSRASDTEPLLKESKESGESIKLAPTSAVDASAPADLQDNIASLCLLAAQHGIAEQVEGLIRDVASLGAEAIPGLRQILDSDLPLDVREPAARVLALIGSDEALACLVDYAMSEDDTLGRDRLIRTLQLVEKTSGTGTLVDALLRSQDDPAVALSLKDTLSRMGGESAVELTTMQLSGDLSTSQRETLIAVLEAFRHPDTVSVLADVMVNTPDDRQREAAAQALAQIGDARSVEALVDALRETESGDVEGALIRALAKVSNKDSYSRLITLFSTSPDPRVVRAAAEALANAGEEGRAAGLEGL